jgi:hypothetical protein
MPRIREAKDADIGITGAGSHAVIFQKGKMVEGKENIDPNKVDAAFEEKLSKLL